MGFKLKDEVEPVKTVITLDKIYGKRIGVDTFNYLYAAMFFENSADYAPNSTSKTRSHVSFFFKKTIDMFCSGVKPIYIFDGKSPKLKSETLQSRKENRDDAREKAMKARAEGDDATYKKMAVQTLKIEQYMIDDLKELFSAFRMPWIQALTEAEAQSAFMCEKGDIYATASQDYDALLFGSPVFIRNLYRADKMRMYGKTIRMDKEMIILADLLSHLGITRKQLVDVAILSGTDFNAGIAKIGVKTAINYIKKFKNIENVSSSFQKVRDGLPTELVDQLREIFLNPPVVTDYDRVFRVPDVDKLNEIMTEKHRFSNLSIERSMQNLADLIENKNRSRVGEL